MPVRLTVLPWLVALAVLATSAYVLRIRHEMVDFGVYRTAGARVLAAEPLYRPEDGHYQFKYFPAFALAMAPFALVDGEVAKAAWFAASVALLVLFVRWSVRALPDRRRPPRALIWAAVVLMAKFYAHELTLGQTNILLGTLLVGSLLSVQEGRHVLAGALVGLGVFVKPYALVLVPWLAVSAGASALAASAAVIAAGLLLPAAIYGWGGNLDLMAGWYQTVTSTTEPNLLVAENVSLGTMWAKWIGVGAPAAALGAATMAAAAALAAIVWIKRRRVAAPEYLEFGQLMLLVPLLSPQGWDYVLLLATPAVVCLVDRSADMPPSWKGVTIAALVLMGLTIYDVLGRGLYLWLMSVAVVTVAALALTTSLVYVRMRALA